MSTSIALILSILFSIKMATTHSSEEKRQLPVLHPESFMTSMDMMVRNGYSVEWHTVITKDGYLLELHRMPMKRRSNRYNVYKLPVLITPGILCSSAEFTNNFPTQSLGYLLADAGYDVWFISFRGNAYSRRHVQYQPVTSSFWDWSWQHMAEYDLPATIDFILGKTHTDQIYLVGHSMGTTVPLAMLSILPAYNTKVRAFFALSPVAYLRYTRGLINIFALLEPVFRLLVEIGLSELLPQSGLMQAVANTICNGPLVSICETALSLVMGDQPGCLNSTRFPVYLSHFPAGTSILTLLHYFQLMKTNIFGKFDLGPAANKRYYNSETPPRYSLSRISTYVHLYYIDGDYLSDGREAQIVYNELTGAAGRHLLRLIQPECGHIWLAWGMEIGKTGYADIIRNMDFDHAFDIYRPRV